MKSRLVQTSRAFLLIAPLLVVLGLAGCASPDYSGLMAPPPSEEVNTGGIPKLHIGDTVTVVFSGLPDELAAQEKPIKEDGTITLPDIGRVKAAGLTPGELEDFIHNLYVPKVYTHLTVTVKTTSDRVYYVRGEVNKPDRFLYAGQITVTKAITTAGDFNSYANRKKVWLTRANGQRFSLNCIRILAGKDPDPPVYPGDQIEVTKTWL